MDILIIGGCNNTDKSMFECEKFNLVKRLSEPINNLVEQRTNHSMCEVTVGTDRFL